MTRADEVLWLDSAKGTGLCFNGVIFRLTISDTKITTSSIDSRTGYGTSSTAGSSGSTQAPVFTSSSAQACSYTYANGVLTLNGSATFSKLSDTVTATGTIPAGTYYSCLVFLDVAADGSLSIRVPADATDLFTGKWRYDGTTFYVLNTALNVVTKYAFSSMAAVSTGSQGNSCYYNYAGSSANGFDAFSLLLDADGSYQIYLWNQRLPAHGNPHRSICSSRTGWGYTSNSLSLSGTTLTINGVSVEQSSSKGTVGAFTSDPALVGTWSLSSDSLVMSATFTADGKMTLRDRETTGEYSYCVVDKTVWYSSLDGFIGKPVTSAYSISGNKLTFGVYPLTKQ